MFETESGGFLTRLREKGEYQRKLRYVQNAREGENGPQERPLEDTHDLTSELS